MPSLQQKSKPEVGATEGVMVNPFADSDSLAAWASQTLAARGLDEVAKWRMVEYWFQVELFRAVEAGQAGTWRHIGDFEHPYHTALPKSGSKTKTKWVDLVLGTPCIRSPEAVVWIELKDLGRSANTALNNARGIGHDLAALWACDAAATKDLWLNPAPHSLDRGRVAEWAELGPGIACPNQLLAQIVIAHKGLSIDSASEAIKRAWLGSFSSRTGVLAADANYEISQAETDAFTVYALVGVVGADECHGRK